VRAGTPHSAQRYDSLHELQGLYLSISAQRIDAYCNLCELEVLEQA
jgi:hypothetical protein